MERHARGGQGAAPKEYTSPSCRVTIPGPADARCGTTSEPLRCTTARHGYSPAATTKGRIWTSACYVSSCRPSTGGVVALPACVYGVQLLCSSAHGWSRASSTHCVPLQCTTTSWRSAFEPVRTCSGGSAGSTTPDATSRLLYAAALGC